MTNQASSHTADSASSLVPVTLLTGFLGSGKTTVLNHLVRQSELSDALVIINEFGEMALDHMMVAHSTENLVMEMSSGCVCCSIRGDLVKTLLDIIWRYGEERERPFRRVLLETTGLADPAPIIQTLMTNDVIARRYRLDGVVATLDLATGMNTLDQHQEAVKQAAVADTLLLTKADLAHDAERAALLRRLDHINPAAPRWEVRNGEIAAQKVLNLGLFSAEGKSPDVAHWLSEEAYAIASPHRHAHEHHDHDHDHNGHDHPEHDPHGHAQDHRHVHHPHDVNRHDDLIRAFCFTLEQPIPEQILVDWLELLMGFVGSHILRVKGVLNIEGNAQPVVVHGVQHIFHPPVTLPAWPGEDRRSRIVFITYGIDRAVIEATFNALAEGAVA